MAVPHHHFKPVVSDLTPYQEAATEAECLWLQNWGEVVSIAILFSISIHNQK